MYELKFVYGKKTFDTWNATRPDDLENTQVSSEQAWKTEWCVTNFQELKCAVDFLSVMNKRQTLYFRGQSQLWDPLPSLFRPSWRVYGTKDVVRISAPGRYFERLQEIGDRVYHVCRSMGVPRWRGLRDIQESRWAVIQHYELWPTPLVDVTSSLRVAAAFALGWREVTNSSASGYVIVAGLPYVNASITFNTDENIVLASLQAVCPPDARRPHLQEGYLVGRFPFAMEQEKIDKKSNLNRRVIAVIKVVDNGSFWDVDFPKPSFESLLPSAKNDRLADELNKEFGPGSNRGIIDLVKEGSSIL